MSEDFNAVVLATLLRLESSQAAFAARQAEFEVILGKLRAEFRSELHGVRTAVMDRIDRLQDDLTKTREDLGANMGGLDHVYRQIAADRDAINGLRETIAVMQRQIRRLQDPGAP